MITLDVTTAALILVYCSIIGWGVACSLKGVDVKLKVGKGKVIQHIVTDSALLVTAVVFIPGAAHIVYVGAIGTLLLVNPFFLISVDPERPITDTPLARLYSYKMKLFFFITAVVSLGFLIKDFKEYWPLMVVQLAAGVNLLTSHTAGMIRRQQKEVAKRKMRGPRYSEISHM